MDGDTAVEPELDSFSLSFPLPFRVAFMIVMAVWGWGLNLHGLRRLQIDVPSLIRYPQRTSHAQPAHHHSTYRLAALLSAALALFLAAFWLQTRGDPGRVLARGWQPMVLLALLAALFLAPRRLLRASHGGRARALATLRRVALGGLAEARDGKFGDILLADVLTSYARVLADLAVCLCMALFSAAGAGPAAPPDRACGRALLVPLVTALPYAIRLRQCLTEYVRVRRAPSHSAGWGGQHLANAAKYASAFPVVIFGALQRGGAGAWYHAWVAACLVNSLYSFYWDVAKDWDLNLFGPARERVSRDYPFGLRRRMHFPAGAYYAVVALDLVLRCAWSVKLSARLAPLSDLESSIFLLEFLEVFRRWVWIFFRVETEWIRNSAAPLGPGADDILLGDYQGKYEDEE